MNFNLGCSGVCDKEALFYFSSNTSILPGSRVEGDGKCNLEIADEFNFNAKKLQVLLLTCWIIMLVATLCAIFLFFDFTSGGMDTYPRQEWA